MVYFQDIEIYFKQYNDNIILYILYVQFILNLYLFLLFKYFYQDIN